MTRSVVVTIVCSATIFGHTTLAQHHAPFTITRIFTGPDRLAHAERIDAALRPAATAPSRGTLEAFQAGTIGGNAVVLRTSPDYVADWHPVARRQYVIMLSGRREIEVASGVKVPVGPGTVLLVEDVSGRGHLTRGVGTEDAVSLVVPLAEER
jgi:hypothetical protein